MSLELLLIILAALIFVCVSLFVSVIWIKLAQAHREKERNIARKNISPILKKLFTTETVDFFKNHDQGIAKLTEKLKGRHSLETLEDVLLDSIEDEDGETKVRARTIAYHFGLPEKCLSMIKDRRTGNIAIGCRKAGFYQYEDAIPGILKALDIFSSNTQYQALMALARIGDAGVLVQAFDKINRFVLINERAVSEIISIFSGDRYELYKKMIHHQSAYLVRLFLKAIDPELADKFIEDIISVFRKGDKETRLAAIIAIGRSGNRNKTYMLIHALNDPEWEIRAMAAKTLGILTDPDAVMALAKAARDREWWVRQNAVSSLLSYPNCTEILASIAQTGDHYAYDSMLYTLGRTGETKLLGIIKEVWQEEQKRTILTENIAS